MLFRSSAHKMYRFDEFTLDLDRETLHRDKDERHLRPQSFAVLRLLLESSGQLVTKTQLYDAVWKDTIVTDTSIAHCIADIRRALGDRGFELIRTVPRRGYRFDHPVDPELGEPPDIQHARDTRLRRPTVLATVLCSAVLLGFGAGHRLNGTLKPLVASEDSVVGTMVAVDQPTTDITAHGHCLKGSLFFKRRAEGDLELAEEHFKTALKIDPEFATAWVGLAGVYSVAMGDSNRDPRQILALLGDATQHAIALAPENPEAHLRRAAYHRMKDESLVAEQHIETALTLDPENILALGWMTSQLVIRGRLDEAIDVQRRIVQADPTSPLQYHNLICYLLIAGRAADAAIEIEHYIALKPQAATEADSLLVDVLILQESYEQALSAALQMAEGSTRSRNLAIIHHAIGNREQADATFAGLLASTDQDQKILVAEVLSSRGEFDQAADWLTTAMQLTNSNSDDPVVQRQASLWLLSPYLIEMRDERSWQLLFARTQNHREASFLLASAGMD